ncbi:MAG: helix-turn-helix transcriptional regulator [Peptococcaceae bacterium]|nr:helix-turn-helix transcriptional regulator [Peptococcaceae bacterium]
MERKENIIDYVDLGLRVRQRREQLGLSQEKLAAISDISQMTLFRLENAQAKTELATLVKVANNLKISLDELLCASLTYDTTVYEHEYHELVKNCTSKEFRLINEVVPVLLKSVRNS